ncbi:hypothetical protein ACIBTV_13825 [Micromonospora sp. NPDC049366]|uniref:hypothetical protein n=1 Tax=Micromonospora sp. NPDC049366 TaxID=3364271 RepID=UPI00378C4F83
MLPVAFTCPLWWVARWAGRLLASLAVVGALTVGAGSPSGALAASGTAFPAAPAVADGQGSHAPVDPAAHRAADTRPRGVGGTTVTGVATLTGVAALTGADTVARAVTVRTRVTADDGATPVAAGAAPHPAAVDRTGVRPPSMATAGIPAAEPRRPTSTGPAPSAPRAPPGA